MGLAMIPFERAMVVFYRLSIATIAPSVAIPPQFAIECLRCSNQQGDRWVTVGQNLEEAVDRCKPNFNTIWVRHGIAYAKNFLSISSAV